MTLSELIIEAASKGLLDTLSLYHRGGQWRANAKRTNGGWQCVPCDDPAAGLEKALRGLLGESSQPDTAPAKAVEDDIFG